MFFILLLLCSADAEQGGHFKINKAFCDAIVLSTGISECSELQMPLDLIGQRHCRVLRAASTRERKSPADTN